MKKIKHIHKKTNKNITKSKTKTKRKKKPNITLYWYLGTTLQNYSTADRWISAESGAAAYSDTHLTVYNAREIEEWYSSGGNESNVDRAPVYQPPVKEFGPGPLSAFNYTTFRFYSQYEHKSYGICFIQLGTFDDGSIARWNPDTLTWR